MGPTALSLLVLGAGAMMATGGKGAERAVIWWASAPAGPGEAVVVAGSGLAGAKAVELARLPNRRPGRRVEADAAFPRRCATLEAVQPSDASVKFALPGDLRQGVYAFRIVTDGGRSNTLLLNRPDAMWVQGDRGTTASPGGWLRAFGRCLALPDGSTRLLLTGPTSLTLRAEADGYAAKAALPRSLPPGDYEVRVHNGYGGSAAWSPPRRIAVATPKPWPTKVCNVMDHGAEGRGKADDTLAVRSAIEAAAEAGGGVVYFPRGRYKLTDTVPVAPRVVLRGEGRDLTMLFWPDTDTPPPALIQGTHAFGIEDLSVFCGNHRHIIAGDLGNKPDAGDVFLRRVLVRASMYRRHLKPEQVHERFKKARRSSTGGGDTVRLGGRHIEITDCDLYGSGRVLFLSKTRGGLVAHNRLYNGRWGWYCISGSDGLVFEHNTLQGADLMSTGGGLNCLDGSAYSQNIYYAHNTLRLFHGWDREAMTSDAGGGAYFGAVASAKGTTLVLAEEPKWGGLDWRGAAVFVLGGRGAGQYRRIASKDGRKVELEAPWDAPPDTTSRVSVTMLQRHYLLVGNSFEDATVAIQCYGISIGHILAGNTSARAGGFHNIGMWYHGYQPSWFCQLLDNQVVEGSGMMGPLNQFPPLDSHVATLGFVRAPCTDPLNRYSVLRRNRLLNNARVELLGRLADALVEGNHVEHADVGIHLDAGVAGAWLRANTFRDVRDAYHGPGIRKARVHPATLARARVDAMKAAVLAALRDVADLSPVERELDRLARRPADDPEVIKRCTACYPRALKLVYEHEQRKIKSNPFHAPLHTPVAIAIEESQKALLGLSYRVSPRSSIHRVLQSGQGGPAEIIVDASFAEGVPEATLEVAVLTDDEAFESSKAIGTVRGGATTTLKIPVTVPKGMWGGHWLLASFCGMLGEAGLMMTEGLRVGTGYLRDWAVVGPFANVDKAALDNATHPPEEQLTLKGEYEGLGGKVTWKPVTLGSNRLDFAAAVAKRPEADAFAAACLAAKEATKATLSVEFAEGLRLWLNGEEIFAGAVAAGRRSEKRDLAVELKQGENVLLAMVSHVKGLWLLQAELRESGRGGLVRPVPADGLFKLPALNAKPKPPPKPTAGGKLAFAEGIAWQLAFEDAFERKDVGKAWKPIRGAWRIEAGTLVTDGPGLIGTAKRLRAPVRIEYDARSDTPGDLTALWVRHGEGWAGGYFIGFGSNGNTANKLLKNGEQVATSAKPLIVPRRWHHVIAQVLPRRVMLVVDGKVALDHREPRPDGSPDTAGVCAWSAGRFDNVRVYTAAAR